MILINKRTFRILSDRFNIVNSSSDDIAASDWALDRHIAGQHTLICRRPALITLSEALVPRVPIVLVEELSSDDVHSLVVVLVDWLFGDTVLAELRHGSRLIPGCRFT